MTQEGAEPSEADKRRVSRTAWRIAATYAAVAAAWILLSGHVADLLARSSGGSASLHAIESVKGLLFVLVTAALVGTAVRRELLRRAAAEAALRETALRFRAALDASPVAVFEQDRALRYTWVANPPLGRTEHDLLGHDDAEAFGAEAAAVLTAIKRRVLERAERVRIPVTFHAPDGRLAHFDLSAAPMIGPEGDVAGIVCAGIDITPMRETERARRRAEERLRADAELSSALVRVGRELIAAFDGPDLPQALCRVTAEVLGADSSRLYLWSAEEQTFQPLASSGTTPEEWEAIRVLAYPRALIEPLLERLGERSVVQWAFTDANAIRLLSPNRAVAGLRVLAIPLRHGEELIGFHAAVRIDADRAFSPLEEHIADRIAQLAAMALRHFRLFERLEHANQLKSEFVATMSHELRTPLNVILGYLSLILEGEFGPLTPELSHVLQRMNRQGEALFELIRDTLDLSRLEAGRVPVRIGPVELEPILAGIADEQMEERDGRDVRFGWTVAPGAEVVMTDASKLRIILRNLISNAFKFTPRGEIAVVAARADDGARISIRDTGIGIAAADVALIFEPFRRLDDPGARDAGGVGLGLFVARQLAGACNGRIDVESEPGKGSTFSIWIPDPA